MADFFALGDGRETTNNDHQEHHQNHNNNNNHISESWFNLFRNEETHQPYKGLELWQPQQNTTHHHQQQHQFEDYSLLRQGFFMVRQGSSNNNNNGGGISCQDCGNQAKKDCSHMRCRTCCKSRGFECQTHVKSTWVPAAERRKRQLAADNNNDNNNNSNGLLLQGRSSSSHEHVMQQEEEDHQLYRGTHHRPSKRLKEIHSPSLEVRNFPQEVNSKASLRCIRVGSINDAQQEYAYQVAVNIEGHVFKGILYDQGPAEHNDSTFNYESVTNIRHDETYTHVGANVIGSGQSTSLNPSATALSTTPDGGAGLAVGTPFLDHTLFSTPL